MHTENKVIDGFFEICQNVCNNRIELYRFGEIVKHIQPGRTLSIDELHDMLIAERSAILSIEEEPDHVE